jgi:hypothetical protein
VTEFILLRIGTVLGMVGLFLLDGIHLLPFLTWLASLMEFIPSLSVPFFDLVGLLLLDGIHLLPFRLFSISIPYSSFLRSGWSEAKRSESRRREARWRGGEA